MHTLNKGGLPDPDVKKGSTSEIPDFVYGITNLSNRGLTKLKFVPLLSTNLSPLPVPSRKE